MGAVCSHLAKLPHHQEIPFFWPYFCSTFYLVFENSFES